ncbi:MAG: zf-HC2 domain-containing protein [Candidatus Eremiobacteraeota bacterium]|nr:zf-HC2 domain-containing protein [Candidatus Eremiobacteraeota bacterium]
MTTHYDRDTLIDYLHGALRERDDAAIFAHLETCADCMAVHDEEAAVGELLRSAARAAELEMPSVVKARVWDAVRHEQPTLVQRLRAMWAPALAVPVAAALVVAAYLGAPIVRQPSAAQAVSAAYLLDEHDAEAQQNPLGPGSSPAVYTSAPDRGAASSAASYTDAAVAATLVDAGAFR